MSLPGFFRYITNQEGVHMSDEKIVMDDTNIFVACKYF